MDLNSMLILLTIALVAILASPAVLMVLKSMERSDKTIARLEQYKFQAPAAARKVKDKRSRSIGQVLLQIGSQASPTNVAQISAIRMRLMRAGFLHSNGVPIYFGLRLILVVVPQLVLLFFASTLSQTHQFAPLGASLMLVVVGLILPDKYLSARAAKREAEYRDGFPDMMDLMVACVEAGVGIDAAVMRVAKELAKRYPNLSLHLNIISLEVRAGRSRTDAWKNFANRLDMDVAHSLATMLRQADEMGSSVGQTLRVFSKDMRQKRMLAAEEQALALSAKLSLPLILFVFPTLLGVLMLPAMVRVFETIG